MSVRISAVLAVLAAALTLGGGAGAGTASQPPKKIDLTNPAAVDSYLTSIGVNPATVVRQVGLNNYAGPNCPGIGWNCTTSTKAVQVSSAGGQNKFDCTGQDPANVLTDETTNTCVIMQGGPADNKAQCKMKDTTDDESQTCVIEQDGQRNLAIVDQLIEQRNGPNQNALQSADVTQTATDKNQAQIHQVVQQDTKVSGEQHQNDHQVVELTQWATGSDNFAHVHQDQHLREAGAGTLQEQNTGALPSGVEDCDPQFKPGSDPNACANIDQTSSGGKNETHLHQNIQEQQQTTAPNATQNQEFFLPEVPGTGGIEAHIDQSNSFGAGTNRKTVHQDARQRQEGGTTQSQVIDPHCCGVSTTTGGVNNLDDFHQTAIQSSTSGDAAYQFLGIFSDTNQQSGGESLAAANAASSSGDATCRFHRDARNNIDSVQFTLTFDPCEGIVSPPPTTCASASAAGEEGPPVGCTPPPSEGDEVTLPSTPTFGRAIDPPNFGEPSDFPGPIFPGI